MRRNSTTLKLYREGPFLFFTCACGHYQAINPTMPWCSDCRVEYDIRSSEVILRPNRKTERFAFAKALNATSGLKFGKS